MIPPSPLARSLLLQKGFTLVELLAVVGIIGILCALCLSGVRGLIENRNRMLCTQRLYAVGRALQLYTYDNDQTLPPIRDDRADGSTWYGTRTLYTYFGITDKQRAQQQALDMGPAASLYQCPSEPKDNHFTMTSALCDWSGGTGNRLAKRRFNTIPHPSQTIVFFEAVDASNNDLIWSAAKTDLSKADPSQTKALAFRHNGAMNALYADSHVGAVIFLKRSGITQQMWEGRDIP